MQADYIIFAVGESDYAIEVNKVERILPITEITPIPYMNECIKGIITYQNHLLPIIDLRYIFNITAYEEEMKKMFAQVQNDHSIWVETFKNAMEANGPFNLTTDHHACRLGKWLDSFSTHNEDIAAILRELRPAHKQLHQIGREILDLRGHDIHQAQEMTHNLVHTIYQTTSKQINNLLECADTVSSQLQKLLICVVNDVWFALQIDGAKDIVQVDKSEIKPMKQDSGTNAFIQFQGVLETQDNLVLIMESINIKELSFKDLSAAKIKN
jgi:chemotaxis signal transduction protein